MVITQEYKSLIEKMVASNKRFKGNEDLFEDFCSEALEKCLFVIEKADSINSVQGYLNKVISTAMINVLKSSGRLIRSSEGYKNVAQMSVPLENPLDNGFLDIKDPTINFVERVTQKETLNEICACIEKLDEQYPEQQFGKIFNLKYLQYKKQREIASYLGISQGEVSKRLLDLMQKISNAIL